jgi:hypothetical protein
VLRELGAGEAALSEEGDDLVEPGGGGAGAQDDGGAELLAEPVVGDPDAGRLEDGGVLDEESVDLGRADVQAAADDDVLDPVDDVEEASVVEVSASVEAVAGVEVGVEVAQR